MCPGLIMLYHFNAANSSYCSGQYRLLSHCPEPLVMHNLQMKLSTKAGNVAEKPLQNLPISKMNNQRKITMAEHGEELTDSSGS